jgi:hypothetical protein
MRTVGACMNTSGYQSQRFRQMGNSDAEREQETTALMPVDRELFPKTR